MSGWLGRSLDAARAREKLGGALAVRASFAEALTVLDEAARVYRSAEDWDAFARTLAATAPVHFSRATPQEGLTQLQSALAILESNLTQPERSAGLAALHVAAGRLLMAADRLPLDRAVVERAAVLARAANSGSLLAEALTILGVALYYRRAA